MAYTSKFTTSCLAFPLEQWRTGISQRGVARQIDKPTPDCMIMGEHGDSMSYMDMPLPDNTLPMMDGPANRLMMPQICSGDEFVFSTAIFQR